jgi:hypothetical protein
MNTLAKLDVSRQPATTRRSELDLHQYTKIYYSVCGDDLLRDVRVEMLVKVSEYPKSLRDLHSWIF